jgi:hypothetical protein
MLLLTEANVSGTELSPDARRYLQETGLPLDVPAFEFVTLPPNVRCPTVAGTMATAPWETDVPPEASHWWMFAATDIPYYAIDCADGERVLAIGSSPRRWRSVELNSSIEQFGDCLRTFNKWCDRHIDPNNYCDADIQRLEQSLIRIDEDSLSDRGGWAEVILMLRIESP